MRILSRILPLAAFAVAVAGAQAQDRPATIVLRAGAFFPGDHRAEDIQKTGYTLGGSFLLKPMPYLGQKYRTSIDANFSTLAGNGDRLTNIDLLLAARVTLGHETETGGVYAGLALGGAWTELQTTNTRSRFGLAGELIVGFQHSSPFSLEGYYRMGTSVSGVRPNGFGVRLGYAF